jgi:amino acid transporter
LYGPRDKKREQHTDYSFKFIALSAVIGGGIFSNNGEALEVSGPVGMIISVVTIGIISISVSEGISELVQQFPAPNAIVEYVSVFVDKDLGWVVGIAYWYTLSISTLRPLHQANRARYAFASVFAVQNLAAAQLSTYWNLSETWQTLAFYVLAPIAILAINFFGVFVRQYCSRE